MSCKLQGGTSQQIMDFIEWELDVLNGWISQQIMNFIEWELDVLSESFSTLFYAILNI